MAPTKRTVKSGTTRVTKRAPSGVKHERMNSSDRRTADMLDRLAKIEAEQDWYHSVPFEDAVRHVTNDVGAARVLLSIAITLGQQLEYGSADYFLWADRIRQNNSGGSA